MTYAHLDFLFSTMRVCIHCVLSQIRRINAIDADCKHREGPTCPDSLVVVQCNGVYKNSLTKILNGYFFAGTRTSGGYPTLVYSILLNIATKLELRKATHAAKLELLEATLVALESYKRRCTVLDLQPA